MAEQSPIYIGWVYGNPENVGTLKKLGVKGEMIWSRRDHILQATAGRKKGVIEHCECTEETLNRLRNEYPMFCRDTFTKTFEKAYRKYRQQFEEATDEDHTD